jgi:broad specificity phosphatase PhoE
MERAEETAGILNRVNGLPMRTEERINEWETYESFEIVRERMLSFFDDWLKIPERIGIAVAHRDPIRALLHGIEHSDFVWADDVEAPFPLPPCGIWRIDEENGKITSRLIWMPERHAS